MNESPKTLNYRLFKETVNFKHYFNSLSNKDMVTLVQFRTAYHKHQTNIADGIPFQENKKYVRCAQVQSAMNTII